MNQANPQFPGQPPGHTVIQESPPGQPPQYAATQPQYVAASPPGVAVKLPGSSHGLPTTPGYGVAVGNAPVPQAQPQNFAQPMAQPVAQPMAQPVAQPVAQHVPPGGLPPTMPMRVSAPASLQQRRGTGANNDQLLPGAGQTVYEFTGAHSEETRSGGKHQTFIGVAGDLGAVPIREERHSNLSRSGGPAMVMGGLAAVVVIGLLTFFLMGDGAEKTEEKAEPQAAAAAAPVPEPAPVYPAAVPPAAVPPAAVDPAAPVDPAAAGGGAAQPATPAEGATPAPAPAPAPTPEPAPAPAPEPAKKKSTSTKKKSTPAPEPEPEPEPEKKKRFPISPSKPPRDGGLDNLPAPD